MNKIIALSLACFSLGFTQTGTASWYSTEACKHWERKGIYDCPTASGQSLYELQRTGVAFAAHAQARFGTHFKVTNLANGRSTVVVIKDRGPHPRLRRVIDLSETAFRSIANPTLGLITVKIEEV